MSKKRRFAYDEKYATWKVHQRRCWFCREPLRLIETTIDHVIPEYLLGDPNRLSRVLADYGLPDDFNINGFENWLPCHYHCNQAKGNATFEFVPATWIILERTIRLAPEVRQLSESIKANTKKDELFAQIFVALEQNIITTDDLKELFDDIDFKMTTPNLTEIILLDDNRWIFREDVAFEGICRCENEKCVGSSTKIKCIFPRSLSNWVTKKGLYWKCYDEYVLCPRCRMKHKRGHVGREGKCNRPFTNQESQTDL